MNNPHLVPNVHSYSKRLGICHLKSLIAFVSFQYQLVYLLLDLPIGRYD